MSGRRSTESASGTPVGASYAGSSRQLHTGPNSAGGSFQPKGPRSVQGAGPQRRQLRFDLMLRNNGRGGGRR
jgi:hypothetical protein